MFRKLLFTLSTIALAASASTTHRFATYNLRYAGAEADTLGRNWSIRGPYCRDLIKEYDFDIVGFQELSGTGRAFRDSITGLSQLDDMKTWLSDYEIVAWDRDGSVKLEYVATAYKKSRYELLDQGIFFISATPDTPSPGWDTSTESHSRCLGWLKLKDKTSGETFIYATTHTNDSWSLDGPYGSQVVAERVKAIAGNLPVMLVADFNTRRSEERGLKAYHAGFHDAALEVPADKNYSLPTTNPAVTWTYNAFRPASKTSYTGREIDYQFYRGMNILERHIITNEFTYAPTKVNYPASDHFPVMVVTELTSAETKNIYVDAAAGEGGDGTISAPFRTLSAAVAVADIDDTIYVAQGTYNESFQPCYSATVIGGWNSSFTAQTGVTTISGEGLTTPPVNTAAYISLTLKNLVISGYKSTDATLDGAIHFDGNDLTLENVTIEGCSAVAYGGAISEVNPTKQTYCRANNVTLTDCTFRNNTAATGGALALSCYSDIDINRCTFADNSATANAGALYVCYGIPESGKVWFTKAKTLVTNSTFHGNKSVATGAVFIDDVMPNTVTTFANTTIADNYIDLETITAGTTTVGGSGIYARLADRPANSALTNVTNSFLNLGHVTVVGNHTSNAAANSYNTSAINVDGGSCRFLNSIIAGNSGSGANYDITVSSTTTLAKESRNIFTTADAVSFTADATSTVADSYTDGVGAMAAMMAGKEVEGKYYASVVDVDSLPTPFVPIKSTYFGAKNIATLTTLQRNIEKEIAVDIDRDGTVGTQLKVDQLGNARNTKSMPGAVEYNEAYTSLSGISGIAADRSGITITPLGSDFIVNAANGKANAIVADALGRIVGNYAVEGDTYVSTDALASGVYILSCSGKSVKFIRR
jgi:endonuclease/exonuclease/phosphatase family metal-dependent hydrolase